MSKNTCFITMAFFLAFVNAFSADIWDGSSVATSFAGGTGTQDDPYQIATGGQLAYLADPFMSKGADATKGKYFELIDDIILNEDTVNYPNAWCPIGVFENCSTFDLKSNFKGVFDGKGHSIVGISSTPMGVKIVSGCLFGGLDSAVIKNTVLLAVNSTSPNRSANGMTMSSSYTRFENIVVQGTFDSACAPVSGSAYHDTLIRVQTHGKCLHGGGGLMMGAADVRESFSTVSFYGPNNIGLVPLSGALYVKNSYFIRVEKDSLEDALAAADTIKNSYYANVSGARDNKGYFPSSSYLYHWAHLFYDSLSSVQLLNIPAGRRLNMKSRAAVDSLNSGLDSLVWAYDSCGINYGYPYLIHNPPYGKNTVCGSSSSSSAVSGSSSSSAESSSSEPPTAVYAGGQPRYSVSVIGSVIRVDNVRDVNVRLFDPLGNLIARKAVYGTGSAYFTVGGAGMYLLRIGGRTENVRVR